MAPATFQFDPKSHSKLKGNDEIRMSLGILVQLALPACVCVCGEVLCVFACNGCVHVRLRPPQPPPEAAAASPKQATRAASSATTSSEGG